MTHAWMVGFVRCFSAETYVGIIVALTMVHENSRHKEATAEVF